MVLFGVAHKQIVESEKCVCSSYTCLLIQVMVLVFLWDSGCSCLGSEKQGWENNNNNNNNTNNV